LLGEVRMIPTAVISARSALRSLLEEAVQNNLVAELVCSSEGCETFASSAVHSRVRLVVLDAAVAGQRALADILQPLLLFPGVKILMLSIAPYEEQLSSAVSHRSVMTVRLCSDRIMPGEAAVLIERALSDLVFRFSGREREVLALLSEGKGYREIAELLNIAFDTVRSYRKNVMRKVGSYNLACLTRAAIASGVCRIRFYEQGIYQAFAADHT
jgi:DNA-binding CsgD family transcriptional regulator